jgi:hypothetical protein
MKSCHVGGDHLDSVWIVEYVNSLSTPSASEPTSLTLTTLSHTLSSPSGEKQALPCMAGGGSGSGFCQGSCAPGKELVLIFWPF